MREVSGWRRRGIFGEDQVAMIRCIMQQRGDTDTIHIHTSIFFIILGAVLLTRFMAYSDLPEFISDAVIGWGLSPLALIIATGLIFLVLGCILDPIGLMLLALPVFLPIYEAAHIDMIWFGILFIKYIEIGLITPPVGIVLFILRGLGDVSLRDITLGVIPFILVMLSMLVLLYFFPDIVLWLPEQMEG